MDETPTDNGHNKQTIWHYIQPSDLHGQGVFARRFIPQGTTIMEYKGKRISSDEADEQLSADPDNPYHTFFFALSTGEIIDGAQQGNDARWINHSCEPNCEGHENEAGDRVFIVAQRDIEADEELLYDYALTIDEPLTDELKQNYACWCGAPSCRGTMLALDGQDSPSEMAHEQAWQAEHADSAQHYSGHTAADGPSLTPAQAELIQSEIQRLRPFIRQEIRREVRRELRRDLRQQLRSQRAQRRRQQD